MVQAAVDLLAASPAEERGAIFTRPVIVDFMLDLIGYTSDRDLTRLRLLEPSAGEGEFLLAAVSRLLHAFLRGGGNVCRAAQSLSPCLMAVELHRATWEHTVGRVEACLASFGVPEEQGKALAHAWVHQDDFLLTPIEGSFHFVVGNPPYLRQEAVPIVLLDAYRQRYNTIYDRADLYVPFFERGLDLLADGGKLCFICSDRWLRNRYGKRLRQKVTGGYHVATYVDMVDVDAFQDEVTAYPAITVIARETGQNTQLTLRPELQPEHLDDLLPALKGEAAATHPDVETIPHAVQGAEPWLLDLGPALAVLRDIERRFPTLEEAGCTVGIGVATGADRVYIGPMDRLDVENDRKLPLVMARDVRTGELRWSGHGVINPFDDNGHLVNLDDYPRLRTYLTQHEAVIRNRNVAQRSPQKWFRTIDRIWPALIATPKLLIPDMSGKPVIAHDPGDYYPHHNLYFMTSKSWDLLALQTVLRSRVTELFMGAYSIKMRGGTLRFQAQYLRRLRLPKWETVPVPVREHLHVLANSPGEDAINAAVFALYGLDEHARAVLNSTQERRQA